ncbi:MAG TPA: cyclopropane-fatty-acyl-phospholipid synthase family protein [Ferrovaceae bacterium]|nr:cyclopropane-fatty-acyl-phospholipid synthase family protein [Ferrovaceae bacterium]
MSSTEHISSMFPNMSNHKKMSWLDRFAKKTVFKLLSSLHSGRLTIIDEAQQRWSFGDANEAHEFIVQVHDARFWQALFRGGSVGAGEAYMEGYWDCIDLTGLLRLILNNRSLLDQMERGWARISYPLRSIQHYLRRNSKSGSQKNISAHYDLGNEFYSLWLDPSMFYSSAYFEKQDSTLEEASWYKCRLIAEALELNELDHVLEIGSGWGGFACYAAKQYGCRVTTVTISEEQYQYVLNRIQTWQLTHLVDVQLKDYRDVEGVYTKLVSIEMIEAVGAEFLPTYFEHCSKLLAPQGIMLIQAITINDRRYQQALREVDFIQKYIFPGGFLPSISEMLKVMVHCTDFQLSDLHAFSGHYAKTLNIWADKFLNCTDKVLNMGFNHQFIRKWQFYLNYCEAGFAERDIDVVHMKLVKPQWRKLVSDAL